MTCITGYLSRLVRDAFAQHPNETYILEATTQNSRDRYQHLGFQVTRYLFRLDFFRR